LGRALGLKGLSMHRKTLSHSLLFATVGVILLVVGVILTQQRHEETLEWRAEAQRAAEALSSIEAIRARTSEAERDRFGYGLTRDKALLGQARNLLAEAVAERDRLSPRLTATAAQRQRLELLTGLLRDAQELRLPGETTSPAKKGQKSPAVVETAPVQSLPKVRELGDLTRAILRDLDRGEIEAREKALRNAGSSDRATDLLLLGACAFALVLMFLGYVSLRDLTLRLQKDAAEKERSLQDAQAMLHHVDDGLTLLDPTNGAVLAANDRFLNSTGYPRGQMLEGTLRPFLPADPDAPSGDILRLLARASREGAVSQVVRLHPRTGADRLVRAHFRRLTLSDGPRVLAVFSEIADLVEQRQTAEAERDRLKQFLLPAAAPALLLEPEQGRVVDATPEAAAYFGTDIASLVSGQISPLAPGEGAQTRETLLSHLEKAVNLEPQRFEWSAPDAQGRKLVFSVSLQRLSIKGQDRLLALLRDLSVEKGFLALEEQLRAEAKGLRGKLEASALKEKDLRQDVTARAERETRLKEDLAAMAAERDRLRSEKEDLRHPLSTVSGILFSLGFDGAYRLLEGKDLLKLGLSPGELKGKKAVDSPRGPLHSPPILKRALSGDSFVAIEETHGILWELHLTPLKDASGQPDGCVGVALDITEREATRRALQSRLDALVALLESSPEAYLLSDREGQVAFACGAGFSGLGLTPWEAQSKSLEEILPDPETWKKARQEAIDHGSAGVHWDTPEHAVKGILTSIQPEGVEAPLLGCLLRPTDLPKAPPPPPPPLPKPWDNVSESSPAALLVLDPSDQIRCVNASCARLLGIDAEAFVGRPWGSWASEAQRPSWDSCLSLWKTGETSPVTLPHTLEGSDTELEAIQSPLLKEDGSSERVVTLRPAPAKVAESRSLDSIRRLERSQKEILEATSPSISKLLADIADIRRNTVGLREKAGWAINPDGLNHINLLEEAAEDAAERLEGWFDYQMALSRELRYTVVDLTATTKETADLRKPDFERSGVQLAIRNLPMIEADPNLLHLMFRNLFDFALAQPLTGTPPTIGIQAVVVQAPGKSASPGWCQLTMDFEGPATTEEALEHLFQAGKTAEDIPGGGLGLLTVRRIAERHGGTVSAQPREGGGTALIVVLPLLAPKTA